MLWGPDFSGTPLRRRFRVPRASVRVRLPETNPARPPGQSKEPDAEAVPASGLIVPCPVSSSGGIVTPVGFGRMYRPTMDPDRLRLTGGGGLVLVEPTSPNWSLNGRASALEPLAPG